jgi:hypothetical protein
MTIEFKGTIETPAFHRIQQLRAVVNGNDELGMWQHKRLANGASIVRSSLASHLPAVVILVPDGENFSVTTYWPHESVNSVSRVILEFARGNTTDEQFSDQLEAHKYDYTWSGGPTHMTPAEAYAWLAVGVHQ